MKIAVIGSNSFAGSAYVNYALEEGAEVIGLSRSMEPSNIFLPYKAHKNYDKNFQFYQANINDDLSKIAKLLEEFQPEIVVDYASQGMVAESWQYPEQWYQTTIVGKVKFHDILRKCNSLKKYIRMSTPEVYGSTDGEFVEGFQYNPSTPYAVSHAAIDMSLKCYFNHYDFPVIFTRSANFYGPHQQLYRIIPKAIISLKKGCKLPLHGGGTSVRAFVDARDIARATWEIGINGKSGEIYHLSTNEHISIANLVKNICEVLGKKFEESIEITEDRPGKDKAYILNTDKIKKELGFEPEISLVNGIEDTIKWVSDNFDSISKLSLKYEHKA